MLLCYYEDAKRQLEPLISTNCVMTITSFFSPLSSQVVLEAGYVEPMNEEESDRSNCYVTLQFQEMIQSESGLFEQRRRYLNLVVFNTEGDRKWTPRMKQYVWNGRYPDTIGIDRDTGEVYLLYLGVKNLEIRHFGAVSCDKLEAVLTTLQYSQPYYIYIDDKAMFNVIDGIEGYAHLLNNTYIMLNGVTQVRVDKRKEGEKDAESDFEATT